MSNLAFSLINSALEKSDLIQKRCDALSQEHHQSNCSINFLNVIDAFCRYIDSILQQNDLSKDQLQQLITLLQELASEIKYIESGIMHKIPWSLIRPFEKCIKDLCNNDINILIRARWSYNYSCVMQDFHKVFKERFEILAGLGDPDQENKLNEFIVKLEPSFIIIEFPYIERLNILYHCLIGHEIGHIFAGEFTEQNESDVLQKLYDYAKNSKDPQIQKFSNIQITDICKYLCFYWKRITEEVLCDMFLVYMFGPAALFALYDFALHFELDSDYIEIRRSMYPPWRFRLKIAFKLLDEEYLIKDNLITELEKDFPLVFKKIEEIRQKTQDDNGILDTGDEFINYVLKLVSDSVEDIKNFILSKLTYNNFESLSNLDEIKMLTMKLEKEIPPDNLNKENNNPKPPSLDQILNASWFYLVSTTNVCDTPSDFQKKYRRQMRLTIKAVESAHLRHEFMNYEGMSDYYKIASREHEDEHSYKGALVKSEIVDLINNEQLTISPLLHPDNQIVNSAVDIRLGTEFIVMKKRAFPCFDPSEYKNYDKNIKRYQDRSIINFKEPFTIHPNSLVLGASLEFVALPDNVMCYVIGKSSWGRLGLIIATATKVDPGFKGCITLELVNHGEVPIMLYPGIPIAQLVFHYTTSKTRYNGDYSIALGPEFPKLGKKSLDWKFWYPDRPNS